MPARRASSSRLVERGRRESAVARRRSRDAPGDVVAVGHRVVHGGPRFRAPVLLDEATLAELRALVELAPLHNAPALAAHRRGPARAAGAPAGRRVRHGVPRHAARTRPRTYAVPRALAHAAGTCAATAFTGSRCSGRAEQVPVDAARRLPPRRGLLGERRPARAARSTRRWASARSRACHGDAGGIARSGRDPLSAAARGGLARRDRAGAGARVGAARAVGALGERRGARALAGAGRAARARRLLLPHRRRDRGDGGGARRARRDRLQRRRGGGIGARPGTRVRRAWDSSASSSTSERNAALTPDADVAQPGLTRARRRSCDAREDVVAARAVRCLLERLLSRPTSPGRARRRRRGARRRRASRCRRGRPRTSASRRGRRAPRRACRGRRSRRRA